MSLAITSIISDELRQVAGRPAPAARTPAVEPVASIQQVGESREIDAFHRRSMIATEAQVLSSYF